MRIKILVISLTRSTDRRTAISSRLRALNLDFEFVDAVDAQSLTQSSIQEIQTSQRKYRDYGRNIGATEIACAMSHGKAYQDILNSNSDGGIILEDDAIISDAFKPFIDWLTEARTVPNGIWLLGGGEYLEKSVEKNYFDFAICSRKPCIIDPKWGALFSIDQCFNHLARACGYFIDKKTAAELVNENQPPIALADDWPFFIEQGWIKPFLCKPYLIKHPLVIDNQSLLQKDRATPNLDPNKKMKFSSRLKQSLGYYRILYRIKVLLHQRKYQ